MSVRRSAPHDNYIFECRVCRVTYVTRELDQLATGFVCSTQPRRAG